MLKYSEFLVENVQRSKAIIAQRMKDYESLKDRLTRDNTLGYLGKLTELLFLGSPLTDLMAAYDRLVALRRTNIRFDIDSMSTLEDIQDAIEVKEREVRVKQVLSQMPPTQKRWFSGNYMTQSDLNLLDKMSKVNSAPFMRKISQYRDKETLLAMANTFMRTAGSPADRAHFKGLAGGGLKVVHEDDRVIIFHTAKVSDLLKVGGDTAWCIKSPSTFDRYTSNGSTQYVLVDFDQDRWDPRFKIGFTLSRSGEVKHAHDILDGRCIPYLSNLLDLSGVDPVNLVAGVRTKVPPPDMTSAEFSDIAEWLKDQGATREQATDLLRSLLKRPKISDCIASASKRSGPIQETLKRLFKFIVGERYMTIEELDVMVPTRSITKAARENLREILRASDVLLPDMTKVTSVYLGDPKFFPYLNMINHDVFKERRGLNAAVDDVIDILTPENIRSYPGLPEEMRRIIGLAQESHRPVLMAAWDKAVNGVIPDLETIASQAKAAGSEPWRIMDSLGLRRPFEESQALWDWYAFKQDLIDVPEQVTLTQFTNSRFMPILQWLKKKGVTVSVNMDSDKVLDLFMDQAVWDSRNGMYKSRRGYTQIPAVLFDQAVRDRIVRTKKKRFDWRPGTVFPITIMFDNVTYTIDNKKKNPD